MVRRQRLQARIELLFVYHPTVECFKRNNCVTYSLGAVRQVDDVLLQAEPHARLAAQVRRDLRVVCARSNGVRTISNARANSQRHAKRAQKTTKDDSLTKSWRPLQAGEMSGMREKGATRWFRCTLSTPTSWCSPGSTWNSHSTAPGVQRHRGRGRI